MKDKKLKIVLDTDVVLHFMKGGRLSLLLDIFASECEYVMLSTTYDEIRNRDQKNQIDNHINLLKNLTKVEFNPTGEMRRVYAMLTSQFGKGESACMAYCQFEHHVIGSNNTRDIREYCNNHGISYLTTDDFLYYAIKRGMMTESDATQLIADARAQGSNVPEFDYNTHIPTTQMW